MLALGLKGHAGIRAEARRICMLSQGKGCSSTSVEHLV